MTWLIGYILLQAVVTVLPDSMAEQTHWIIISIVAFPGVMLAAIIEWVQELGEDL